MLDILRSDTSKRRNRFRFFKAVEMLTQLPPDESNHRLLSEVVSGSGGALCNKLVAQLEHVCSLQKSPSVDITQSHKSAKAALLNCLNRLANVDPKMKQKLFHDHPQVRLHRTYPPFVIISQAFAQVVNAQSRTASEISNRGTRTKGARDVYIRVSFRRGDARRSRDGSSCADIHHHRK